MLAAFQHAVKEKTPAALMSLVNSVRKTRWQNLPEALGPLAQYEEKACLEAISTPGVSTDAAFVVLQSLISRMEVMAAGPYCVEHDQSKNLSTYNNLLQQYINHEKVLNFDKRKLRALSFHSNSLP